MISSKVSLFYSAKHVTDMKRSEMEVRLVASEVFIGSLFTSV